MSLELQQLDRICKFGFAFMNHLTKTEEITVQQALDDLRELHQEGPEDSKDLYIMDEKEMIKEGKVVFLNFTKTRDQDIGEGVNIVGKDIETVLSKGVEVAEEVFNIPSLKEFVEKFR